MNQKNYSNFFKKISSNLNLFLVLLFSSFSTLAFAQPANNNPCGAITLTPGASCVYSTYTNVGATNTTTVPAPACASYSTGTDVWFAITVPAGGSLIIDSQTGTLTDSGMELYTAPGCGGPFTSVACDDDSSPNGLMSMITATGLTPGTVVYVRFWGYSAATGTFGICVQLPPPPPPNDNPCSATPIPVNTAAGCVYTNSTNVGATVTASAPVSACGFGPTADVWFTAIVPASGNLALATNAGGLTDASMAVYTGPCGSLSLIGCNDNSVGLMPGLTLSGLTPGSTVWINVWDNFNDQTGTFGICATDPPPPGPADACSTAEPFCTAAGVNYPASTGVTAPVGPNYGCLFTQPNPAWFYLNIATSGNIDINLSNSASVDIDFICWGPFASQAAMCGAIFGGAVGIDCSYSTAATEQVNIVGAVAGQWYMLLVTNFSNAPTNITASAGDAPGVDGTTNCAILCNMTSLTATPGPCAPATGLYTVSGTITTTNPPTTGTLTITNSCGGTPIVLTPPFSTSIAYSYPGVTATGGACSITAVFSSDITCTLTTPYTSPAPCNTCVATATNTGPYCAGATIQLNATGGGTYSWSGPGGFTSTLQNPTRPASTVAMSGTYTVTVTAGSVTCTATTTVTVNPPPTVTAEPNLTFCAGAAVPANTFASTPVGATYTWTNSNTTIGLAASGTTSVPAFTATNATTSPIVATIVITPTLAGCVGPTSSYTITINPLPTSTFTQSPNQCLTGNSFTFTNTGSSVGGPWVNSWNFGGGGATPATSTAVSPSGVVYSTPGTYTITHTITGPGGCTSTTTSTVTIYPMPVVTVNSPTICAGQTATLTAGGAATYTWSAGATSTGVSTASASPATTTSYTVTGTNANGCTATAVATVTVTPLPPVTVNSPTICAGATATLTAAGGTTYVWSTTSTANPITVTPAGTTTYTVTGTAGGCTNSAIATVTVNPLPTVTAETNVTVCAGATVPANTFTSAPAGATFTWTNSNAAIGLATSGTTSTPAFTATNATAGPITGTITITPTLAGCVGTPITYTITVNPLPITTVNSPTICPGGTATLTAAGASTYTWTAGVTVTGVATATASPATTTSYTVTGTSAAGCTSTAVATVTVASTLAITVNSPTICSGSAATLTAGGGATYTWSAGATSTGVNTASASPTTTTSYTVTGTSAGCSNTAVATVTVNPLPTVTAEANVTVCAGATVPANTFASTPAGATFTWTNSDPSIGLAASGTTSVPSFTATNATSSPIVATITVTPTLAGCVGTPITYTITVNPLPITAVTSATVCPAGTATLTASGATTYSWSAGVTVTGVTTATATPGSTTSYTVTGTSLGCTSTAVATVTVSSALTVAVNSPTICAGQVANLTATGAATYSWSAGASSTGVNTATAVPSTTTSYTVTGTSSGCTNTAIATVTVNPLPTVAVNSPTICAGSTATLTASGAASYVWSAGATSTGVTTATASPTSTTSYTVTGTTAGCTGTAVATVTVNPLPIVAVNSVTVCPGQTANLTATGAATYTWSAGATPTGVNTASATPGSTTTYTVTGTSLGCTATAVATVTIGGSITVTVNSPTICPGGTATLTATGGATYVWSAGATSTGVNTATASPGTTTSYTVTGTSGGCTGSAIATVTVSGAIVVAVNSPTICAGQTANLTASGATSYTWSAGASSTGVSTADATPATTTSYTVTGTTGACTGTAVTTVTVTPLPVVTVTSPTICIGASATLTGGGATTYTWSAGATSTGVTTATTSPTTTTSYTVTGTASGCTNTAVGTVTVNPLPIITVNSPSICLGSTATLTATGATTYTWSAGAVPTGVSTATASPLVATTYTVTGTLLGCVGTATSTVTINASLTVDAGPNDTICFGGSTALSVTPNGAGYTYSWTPASGLSSTSIFNPSANPTTTTTYVVVVTDINGCTGNDNVTIYSDPQINPVVSGTNITCNSACNGSTAVATTGGSNIYTYLWSNAVTTITNPSLCPGSYSVTVTDSWGCTTSGSTTITQPTLLTSSITGSTPVLCNGACNGTATAAGAGGTGAYTYSWNTVPIQTSATATGMCAGTYTVTVRDANNCSSTATVTISQPSVLTAAITVQTNVNCFGGSTGSVTIAGSGGTPTYQYSINGGTTYQASGTFSGLTAGSYTIIVKDGNNCTVAQPVTITQPTVLTSSITTQTNVLCFGGTTGSVTVAAAGGSPTYQYSINGGTTYQSSGLFTGLTAGAYTVIILDANGCTINQAVTITQPTQVTVTATKVDATCGAANGSLTATGANGTPGYTYSIGGAFQASGTFVGLAATTYTVTVKDINGCTNTTTITIVDLSGLVASITAQTNVSCNGGTNGSVTVTASSSTGPYLYSINGGALGGSGTFTALAQGSYTVVAQDANGCTISVPVTITQPTVLTGVISAQTNISCFGGSNGSVTITASGGTPTYTYSLDGGAFVSGATFSSLTIGAHTIVVKDINGCIVSVPVTISQPTALTLTTTVLNATCTAANGSATVTPAGGTPGYSYLWSPAGTGSTTVTNSAITAGNYTVTVTDANGCTQSASTVVGSLPGGNAVISSSANVSCTGANDGTATVSMGAGSTPPFTYSWTPTSQTTVTATNLGPASYTVTVTDGNGCISTASVVITEPTLLTQTFTTTNVSCFGGNDGVITINPAGGTPGYTYLWSPGSYTTQTVAGLPAGTYTCVYTDANGCQKTGSVTITQPTGMTLTSTQVDATCNMANGSATVSVTGGTGPYTYLWSDAAAQTTATATALPSNTYAVTVTDANSCSQTLAVTINNLAGPVATVFSTNNVSCFGQNDGSATVTVTGGTIPFTFVWNNGQTLPTATNLVAGTYTLVATDLNGCIASTSVTITEPLLLDLGIAGTNPTCFGSCDGTLTSNTFGGTAPYTYLWNAGGVTTPFNLNLCAGTYTLQVTDVNGCTAFKPATLTAPVAVSATTTSTNVSCSGLCNATATANPLTGTGPFTYLWSDINAQTTQTATGLCAGTYTVTVTDAGGCTATATAIITSPASMVASITSLGNVTCFGACDGFASATVVGGSAPYSYLWMPTSTAGAAVNNLCASNYTVTVTDANGCTASTTANITEPFPLVASITSTNVTCFNACDGTANAVYTGGTGPYTFQWTPTFATTPNITNICDGIHNLTVTDGNGCQAFASVVITQPTILAVTTTTTNSSCGNADGSACAAITGGVGPFSYSWNDPSNQLTSCASNINAGVYTISITDGNGCSVTGVANVNDNTAPVVTIPTSANVTCAGVANGSAQSTAVGGIIPYTISWVPSGQTTAFISGLSGGIYSVVYTDSIGCIGSASVTINEPSPLVSGVTASSNVSCFLSCNGTATVAAGGGTAPYTYLWNSTPTQTTATASGLCAAGYTVTITDANGCVSTCSTTITTPPALNIALVSANNVSCNGGSNGSININVTGGTPGYTYTWTPSVGSGPTVTGLIAGAYSVAITDQNGCTANMSFNITEPALMTLSTINNPSTCGNANGFVSVTPTGGTPGYTYLWDDPLNQTTAIATSLYAGNYLAVVTDSHGCTASIIAVLPDQAGPTLNPFTYSEPLCNGTALGTATAFPIGGTPLYTYLWSGIGAQTTQTATALVAGTYTVVVSDANGCSVTGSVTVTEPSPTLIITSPTDTICIGENAQIYGAGYGGTPTYTYFWTPSSFVGSGPFVVNPTTTTTYDVYLTDANGCVSPTETITLFVNPPVTVTATDVSVCSGSFVTISALATGGNGGPYTYTWSNSFVGASQSVSPSIAASPVDYVVIVDDGCSLLATDTATVTVNPLAISFMLANDTAGCEDFTVSFNGVSDIGTIYSWNFGDGSPDIIGEPVVHTYPNSGSFNVTLTVTTALGCVSSITNNNYIDVYPAPIAAFSYSPTTVTQTAPLVSFVDLSTGLGTPFTWDWDFIYPLGTSTDTMQNPSFSYNDTGSFTVQLIVTNSYGCTDTAYNTVEVLPEYTVYVPNAFTPLNHDGNNDTFFPQGVGINPDNFEMTIYDRWGNMIYKTTDVNKGWDGKANGGDKVAQIDVYVWKITTEDYKGDQHRYIGTVTIVK